MANFMASDNIFGKMVVSTKGNFERGRNTAMGYGEKEIATKNMKASFYKIESKVMAYTHGKMEISTKEITTLTYDMEPDKCTGMIAPSTKDHGLSINLMGMALSSMDNNSSRDCSKMESWLISAFLKTNIEASVNSISMVFQPKEL